RGGRTPSGFVPGQGRGPRPGHGRGVQHRSRGPRPFVRPWRESPLPPPPPVDPIIELDATEGYWQDWVSACTYDGEWRDAVVRSLLTLKVLTYTPPGGIVATTTPSLPEQGAAGQTHGVRRGALDQTRRGHLGDPQRTPPLHPLQTDGLGRRRPCRQGRRGLRSDRPGEAVAFVARRPPRRDHDQRVRRETQDLHPVPRLGRIGRRAAHGAAGGVPAPPRSPATPSTDCPPAAGPFWPAPPCCAPTPPPPS